jgi:AraC family transcriptional regulator of adaptative response / DNA-3-methyladenine glycosylase II
VPAVTLDFDTCYRAFASRDPRFDGRFFAGVLSTGVYCRPVCPARTPRPEHVRFHRTAAEARRAGMRPCRRCRPEGAPGDPDRAGRPALVRRALALIGEGYLDDRPVADLAGRLHVSERQLRRMFAAETGASPSEVARTRRAAVARMLIDQTDLTMARVAAESGYRSVRRFNDEIRAGFGRTPRELRTRRTPAPAEALTLRLPYRPPLDWDALLAHLAARAVPGVEEVAGGAYRRTAIIGDRPAVVTLRPHPDRPVALLEIRGTAVAGLADAAARGRRLADLDADPLAVAEALGADPLLAPLVHARPGLRVAGAWDPAETAVRAVVGQQVSVPAAARVAGRIAADHGTPLPAPDGGLTTLFPAPAVLAGADPAALPMPAARGRALVGLAAAIAGGRLDLAPGADPDAVREVLLGLPGVGPWTAEYIALRALGDPDALPAGDLVLRRALGASDAAAVTRRAAPWAPWRAYAATHLWTAAAEA